MREDESLCGIAQTDASFFVMLDLCMNAPSTAPRTEVRLIGQSAAVLAMKDEIDRAARSDA